MAIDTKVIDVHLHAWWEGDQVDPLLNPNQPAILDERVFTDTLAQMDQLGIAYGVISGPNNVTAEWGRRAPGRFILSWMPSLLADDPEAEAGKFEAAVKTQGFCGLGEFISPYVGLPLNDSRFFPLYKVCEEQDVPVFFHTGLNGPDFYHDTPLFRVGLGNPLFIEDILAAFPKLKVVMAHMSFPFTEQAAYMLHTHSNVYMDIGVVNWYLGRTGFQRLLKQVIDLVGAGKILFGTDQMSFPQMMPVGLSAITEAPYLNDEDKQRILWENARQLLRLG